MDSHEVFLTSINPHNRTKYGAQSNRTLHTCNSWLSDVTSCLFGLVKYLAVKKIKSDFQLGRLSKVFSQ